MSKKEYAAKRLNEFMHQSVHVGPEQMIDFIIDAVKEECCSGELKWEPTPFSLSRPGWSVPKECTDCFGVLFSKSEPGCLKPGCLREQKINSSPKLIQGYTAEQWQEIIDGGYLVEVAHTHGEWIDGCVLLKAVDTETQDERVCPFKADKRHWNHCRPAQIKGVMRPIFVEPVDEEVYCHFFSGSGSLLFSGKWAAIGMTDEVLKQVKLLNGATKYIEL